MASLTKGGDHGNPISSIGGEPSLLLKAVRRADEALQMPPDEKDRLSDAQIAEMARWIETVLCGPIGPWCCSTMSRP